jgi:hypothetical protein
MDTVLCNVKKKELNKRGIIDFKEWNDLPNTVYIGRNMSFYVPHTYHSKWHNPYSVKKYGRDECLRLYKEHILSKHELYDSLDELIGKELGCWCFPERCHGNILLELLEEKIRKDR